jgi:hypothetical protein
MAFWEPLQPHSLERRDILVWNVPISFLIFFTKERKLAYEITMLCVPFWTSESAKQF